jgi:hypothetical protein
VHDCFRYQNPFTTTSCDSYFQCKDQDYVKGSYIAYDPASFARCGEGQVSVTPARCMPSWAWLKEV